MINEIVDLLPSADLKAKIKKSIAASPELAALANAYIEFEQNLCFHVYQRGKL
jgi:hypothetical protein